MKKKELGSLRPKSILELKGMVDKKKIELGQVLAKILAGKEKNIKKGKIVRLEIAQILTLIREKELVEKL